MRTSLRVLFAAVSTLLLGAVFALVPSSTPVSALNGVSTINVESKTCAETDANYVCTVNVTVAPAPSVPFDTISATIVATDGTARKPADYTYSNQTLTWQAGDPATKTVNVTIVGDNSAEPDENFTLAATNPQSASAGQTGTVTITNDDGTPPSLQITAPAAAAEGNADNVRAVKVKVNNPTDQEMSVNYATSDGSATSDPAQGAVDYTPITTQTLTWPANNGDEKTINVTVKGDTIPEPDERFFLNFGSPNNVGIVAAQNPANIDLLNDDGAAADIPKLTLQNIPDKIEGDTSQTTQTITVAISPAPPQTVTVDYATSNGTAVASAGETKGDYETTKGTLTFPANVGTSKTFTVPVNGDPVDEQDEIYHVTLSNPHNATIADPATKDAKILNDDYGQISTAPGAGGGPHTRIFGATGSDLGGFMAYGTDLTSGIHVGRGDFFKADGSVGSDGVDEVITGPSNFPAGSRVRSVPQVRIFATDGRQLASFNAYDPSFGGGVYVAAGNLDGDTSNGDELVTGAGPGGGPHVRIWRVRSQGSNNAVEAVGGFFAYAQSFGGGVRVAVGNETGDGKDEIVTAPGPGGGPHVRVWAPTGDLAAANETAGFMAYGPEFSGGVTVAAAAGRIVTGPGAGGGPHVRVFDGTGQPQGGGFMAYDPSFTGGVSVGMGNLDNDLAAEIVTGAGAGGGPHVKVFRQDGSLPFGTGFFAYDPNFHGGVEVAVSQGPV